MRPTGACKKTIPGAPDTSSLPAFRVRGKYVRLKHNMPNKKTLIEIRTPRLLMRQWRPEDRVPFAAMNADPRVMEYFPAPLDRTGSDKLAERCEEGIAANGWGLWALELPAGGEFIGFTGLCIPAATLPFSPCIEIGWRLAAEHHGFGYATEAAGAALQAAFTTLNLDEIVSFTSLLNQKSRAVMCKIGMRSAGNFGHPRVAPDSPLHEHCLFKITREEWLNSGAARADIEIIPRHRP